MKPIRLAVIFDQQIRTGGGYQQALNAALLTKELPKELAQVVFFTTLNENAVTLAAYGVQAEIIHLSFFSKVRTYLRMKIVYPRFLKVIKKFWRYPVLEKKLIKHRIDLVYFLSPSKLAQSFEELNYITTVWDLCHRDDPEFPEVRWNRQFEGRDKNYQAILPRATAIFVDSESGKKNVAHRYGVDLGRIHVMPFQPAEAIRREVSSILRKDVNINEKYQLNSPYVFYPAQFWAHKNHIYLLEGLISLEKQYGLSVGAIFCGGDPGNRAYVEGYVNKLGLKDRVRFTGFVSNEEIIDLYRESIALVMPSYFGPTNLPPLEAFQLSIPVLYPDKEGLRDQVGDAGLLIDLEDPSSMAVHLKNLIEDKNLRERLILAGHERLVHFDTFDRVGILKKVIQGFRWRRMSWE